MGYNNSFHSLIMIVIGSILNFFGSILAKFTYDIKQSSKAKAQKLA